MRRHRRRVGCRPTADVRCDGIGDALVVARQHDDPLDPEAAQCIDRCWGIVAGRIHDAEHSEEAWPVGHDHRGSALRLEPILIVADAVRNLDGFEEGEVADLDGVAADGGGDALANDGGDIGRRRDGVAVEEWFDAGRDGSSDGVVAEPFDR